IPVVRTAVTNLPSCERSLSTTACQHSSSFIMGVGFISLTLFSLMIRLSIAYQCYKRGAIQLLSSMWAFSIPFWLRRNSSKLILQILHKLHIFPPKCQAGSTGETAELTFWVGGMLGCCR